MILDEETTVYVACPSGTATGGPELLHQLVHSLRLLGVNAYMYYLPVIDNPVHKEYECYSNPYVRSIKDDPKSVLVVPEVRRFVEILGNFHSVRKVIWWLSVDNFYKGYISNNYVNRLLNKLSVASDIFKENSYENRARSLSANLDLLSIKNVSEANYHLVQSQYAYDHLLGKGIDSSKISRLSDYVNDSFLQIDLNSTKKRKKDLVIYNPRKGFHFTKKIICSLPHVEFKALQNMTRQEVVDTMLSSKVYIDFGNHPGKDRMPREAALCGNCVITGKRGSARNSIDVSIPDEYKFDDNRENIPNICRIIRSCIEDYESRIEDFSAYRKQVRNERNVFESQVESFVEVVL